MINTDAAGSKSSRVILFLTIALTVMGLTSFFLMPREEDPRIKRRNAVATIVLPGAEPTKIERLVTRPLEDELLKVEELKKVEAEIRLNVAVVKLELKDDVSDLSRAWKEVDDAIARALPNLPAEVNKPLLDFGVLDVEAVVVAVTGSDDRVVLIDAAKKFRDRLLRNTEIAEVKLFGAPNLEILISVDEAKMHAQGISVGQLLRGVQENNSAKPAGLVVDEKDRVLLNQDNDFESIDRLSQIKFETGRLKNVELGSLSNIKRSATTPAGSLFRWNGKTAVGVGIIPKQGLNIQSFGEKLKKQIESEQNAVKPLQIEMVAFQPLRTKERIDDLLMSLLSGMALIAIFLSLTSTGATAIIVSACVPITSLIGLFFYYLTGGVLHQISIAAFVISIGQFIDNIIVVIDSIQAKMRAGLSSSEAAAKTSTELKSPMAFATATGICAFLPMLSAQGSPADFIFSLPLVAVITLITSYFVAIYFTPLLTSSLVGKEKRPLIRLPFHAIERGFSSMALGPFWRIASIVSLVALVSFLGFLNVEREFFPESDRNEFLLAVELNSSADTAATDAILKEVERLYGDDPRIQSLAAFVGGDIPRFYYNLPNPRSAPQAGQILITTADGVDVKTLGLEIEAAFTKRHPEVDFTAQFLQQGPPINAKVEINVFSESPQRREALTTQIREFLNGDQRVRSVRRDDFFDLRQLQISAIDAKLTDVGMLRDDLNQVLAFYSSGVPISSYRFDREIMPIRVRARSGVYRTPESLKKLTAVRGRDRDFKIEELARFQSSSILSVLRRENGQTFSRVLADLKPSFTFDRVMRDVQNQVSSLELRSGESVSFGGDAKGAGEANASILKVVPPAMILLIVLLLIEFGSFRKVLIAVLALPVTLMGVFPGLWIGGAQFGFMSLLGILALVGIAINNIILLLEAMESEGSIKAAISTRLRAIVLTTILTLLGLIPLALSPSSLWPPLAWTMISGLVTGTVATLIVVPALYRLFFSKALAVGVLAVIALTVQTPQRAHAQDTLTVDHLLAKISNSDDQKLSNSAEVGAKAANSASWREAFAPQLSAGGTLFQRDRELLIATPFGNLTQETRGRADVQLELRQPVFNAGKMIAARTATEKSLEASGFDRDYDRQSLRTKFGAQAMEILIRQRERLFVNDSIDNLRARRKDVERLIEKGRQSRSDLLKLDVAIERLSQSRDTLDIEIKAKSSDLRSALKIESDFVISPPNQATNVSGLVFNAETGDLRSLQAQTEALEARKDEIKAIGLPSVDGFARVVGTDGRNLTDRQWAEVGIELRWEIWGGGVRASQVGQIEAQRSAFMAREALRRRQKLTMFHETRDKAEEKFRRIQRLRQLTRKADANKTDEEKRYFEGRGSLNDLIEADTLNLELQKDRDVVGFNLIIDCMHLQLWAGHQVSSECHFSKSGK